MSKENCCPNKYTKKESETIKKINNDVEEIENKIYEFEELKKQAIDSNSYVEAQEITEQLKQLEKVYKIKKRQILKIEHQKAAVMFETTRKKDYINFEEYWDSKIKEFEKDIKILLNEVQEKQELEFKEYFNNVDKELPTRVQTTKKINDLKKRQKQLVHAERYLQADKLTPKILKLEQEQVGKLEQRRHKIKERKLEQFQKFQTKEMKVLVMKIDSKRNELFKQRDQEFEKLHKKYKNINREIINIQGKEANVFDALSRRVRAKHFDGIAIKNARNSRIRTRSNSVRNGSRLKSKRSSRMSCSVQYNTLRV